MEKKPDEPRVFIDNRGNWFQDGIKIQHRLTYLYNNQLLDRDEEGRYFLDDGSCRLYVRVEDTPFVVKMLRKEGEDYYITLNDETEEKLNLETLRINNENIPYTKVKNGKFDARFTRPAYYELMKYAVQEGEGFYIESKGQKHHLVKS
jgi:uncharacterized protein